MYCIMCIVLCAFYYVYCILFIGKQRHAGTCRGIEGIQGNTVEYKGILGKPVEYRGYKGMQDDKRKGRNVCIKEKGYTVDLSNLGLASFNIL